VCDDSWAVISWAIYSSARAITEGSQPPLGVAENMLGPVVSQTKLTMRAKAHKFETFVIRLTVDENEVRPDVAVAVIVPFAGQWVIEIPVRQRCVGGEQVDDLHQLGVQLLAVPAGFLPCSRAESGRYI